MDDDPARRVTLDPGLTALALRGLQERDGHYPFIERFLRRHRPAPVLRTDPTLGRARLHAEAPSPPYFAIVRRGETQVFQSLQEHFQTHPKVRVIWDRRVRDRRSGRQSGKIDERRRAERRLTPEAVWGDASYVLVPRASATAADVHAIQAARTIVRAERLRRQGTPAEGKRAMGLSERERAALIGLIVEHMTTHLEGRGDPGCSDEAHDLLWTLAQKLGATRSGVRSQLFDELTRRDGASRREGEPRA